ncbi:bsl1965 [Bradyrhizobium diazoefficiens USDA 110]|uniref:Bsl1965 protein n=4 Tax=Bradyrhizobium TaxID=374 RepID=Q89TI4_BRADU|nr:transposase, mutator type [Bradyrhizobium japonicum SEMIA 5079]KGJ67553.1 putative transposase, mutator type [Bradyrhizobium diazoefficiens SEMIA 5080]BAC47230.1 bsl1965 [Bradyrhizobium diazoefficiens USDA 110]
MNLIALGQIGSRRLLPHRFQCDLCLQHRVDLPSRLLRHHALRRSNGAALFQPGLSSQNRGPFQGTIRRVTRNVKRRRDAGMTLRWVAAGMIEANKGFR